MRAHIVEYEHSVACVGRCRVLKRGNALILMEGLRQIIFVSYNRDKR